MFTPAALSPHQPTATVAPITQKRVDTFGHLALSVATNYNNAREYLLALQKQGVQTASVDELLSYLGR